MGPDEGYWWRRLGRGRCVECFKASAECFEAGDMFGRRSFNYRCVLPCGLAADENGHLVAKSAAQLIQFGAELMGVVAAIDNAQGHDLSIVLQGDAGDFLGR